MDGVITHDTCAKNCAAIAAIVQSMASMHGTDANANAAGENDRQAAPRPKWRVRGALVTKASAPSSGSGGGEPSAQRDGSRSSDSTLFFYGGNTPPMLRFVRQKSHRGFFKSLEIIEISARGRSTRLFFTVETHRRSAHLLQQGARGTMREGRPPDLDDRGHLV